MAIVFKTTIGVTTEDAFMRYFLDDLLSADSRIKLLKEESGGTRVYAESYSDISDIVDAQYFTPGTTTYRAEKPIFKLYVDEICCIQLTRSSNANASASQFSATRTHLKDGTTSSSGSLIFCSSSVTPGTAKERRYVFRTIANAKALVIQFGSYNTNLCTGNPTFQTITFTDTDSGTTGYCTTTTSTVPSSFTIDDGTTVQTSTLKARLDYTQSAASGAQVALIKSKAFTDVSDARTCTTDALYDCSTLSAYKTEMVIDSKRYFSITPNTLVPVS
jgi:hypothetical protein